jgi:hypothetical protein
MPAEQALQRLSQALTNNPAANVVIASEPDPETGIVLQRLTLRQDLAGEFLATTQNAVPAVNEDLILRPYDPGYTPGAHELSYVELANHGDIAEQVRQVSQVQQAELFREDDEIVDHLRFYAIIISPTARHRAAFFRTYSPTRELTRHRGFAALLDRGSYNKVDRKIFLFDYGIDCFAWDGYLFIRNVAAFQRIFEYFEELRACANETVDTVSARIPVSNLDEFRAACTGQLQMMSKLAQIARKPYLNQVTMQEIRRTIDAFHLEVQIVEENGQEKVLFEKGAKKRWLLLKLLDDDYLGSIMTNQKYEVNSKSAL